MEIYSTPSRSDQYYIDMNASNSKNEFLDQLSQSETHTKYVDAISFPSNVDSWMPMFVQHQNHEIGVILSKMKYLDTLRIMFFIEEHKFNVIAALNVFSIWSHDNNKNTFCYLINQIAKTFCISNPDQEVGFLNFLSLMPASMCSETRRYVYDFIYHLLFELRDLNGETSRNKYNGILLHVFNRDDRTRKCLTEIHSTEHNPVIFDKIVQSYVNGPSLEVWEEVVQPLTKDPINDDTHDIELAGIECLLKWRCPERAYDTEFFTAYKRLCFNVEEHIDYGTLAFSPGDYPLLPPDLMTVINEVVRWRTIYANGIPNEVLFHIFSFLIVPKQ
jgi:hypothetical protein